MARTHERVFAFVAALLFLGTTLAISVAIVLQVRQQNKAEQTSQQVNEALNQTPGEDQQSTEKEGQLQGTNLTNFTPLDSIAELEAIDLQEGTGEVVKAGDTITAHYTGAVAKNGVVFQSSLDTGEPIAFSLNGVIKGWTDGVPGMKVGGKRRLLIPAAQAYGTNPPSGSGIPADADLVFDIELVKIGE